MQTISARMNDITVCDVEKTPPGAGFDPHGDPVDLDTPGGRFRVKWDLEGSSTTHGQIVFFMRWLDAAGLFDGLCEDAPFDFKSPNAPSPREVLSTLMCGFLCGNRRYAHLAAFREDRVLAQLCGVSRFVSSSSARRALARVPWDGVGSEWIQRNLAKTWERLLNEHWLLDIDVQVKPLFGHQEGAELGYNPRHRGRPSHAYHTYWMGNIRMSLGVGVEPGNRHTSSAGTPGLAALLDRLPADARPKLIRGDCGYGNEPLMAELERRDQPYLFRLRMSANVARFVEREMAAPEWQPLGDGAQGRAGRIRLTGWTRERDASIIRMRKPVQKPATKLVADAGAGEREGELELVGENETPEWEYTVLASNSGLGPGAQWQLYRERAASENPHDELKNQWGWGGFTTQNLDQCRLCANLLALVYNWWSLFVRTVEPGLHHREIITTRPRMLDAPARLTRPGGVRTLTVTPLHARRESTCASMQECVGFLNGLTARQLPPKVVFRLIIERAFGDYLRSRLYDPLSAVLLSGP